MRHTEYFLIKTSTISKVQAERIKHVLLNDFFESDLEIYTLDDEDKKILIPHLNTKGVDFYEKVSK